MGSVHGGMIPYGLLSEDVTGTKAQCLKGSTFLTSDSNDEAAEGDIVTKNNSGKSTISVATPTVTFEPGYYPNSHGAKIATQEVTVNPGYLPKTVSPSSGKVISKVTVSGDPNLVSANILSGVTIFGVSGTARKYGSQLSSSGSSELGNFRPLVTRHHGTISNGFRPADWGAMDFEPTGIAYIGNGSNGAWCQGCSYGNANYHCVNSSNLSTYLYDFYYSQNEGNYSFEKNSIIVPMGFQNAAINSAYARIFGYY